MEVDLDANNNSTDKKGYSLRPRSAPKTSEGDEVIEELPKPRSRTQKSSKQKSLPLSKYRRKTANARERSRMREINEAFETLRRSIPLISTKCDNPSEKNTKISTLRLAMKYITVLSSALRDSDVDSDKDSIFSEYSLTPPEYREAYTPTSTSDNSDFSDSFFVTTPPQDRPLHCVSPFSSSSSYNILDIPLPTRLPVKITSNSPIGKTDFQSVPIVQSPDIEKAQNAMTPLIKPPPSYPLSRVSQLEDINHLDSPSEYSPQLAPFESDLRYANLTPITIQLQSTSVLEDWDEINFSRVDLDELLST